MSEPEERRSRMPVSRQGIDVDRAAQMVMKIMVPVSVTLVLVVITVRSIQLPERTASAAMILYHENEGDSVGQKAKGSAENALVFVLIIGAATFVMALLFKYGYTKVIYAWLFFATFSLLGGMGAQIASFAIDAKRMVFDWPSLNVLAYNFGVLGVVSIFYMGPKLLQQGYLILVGAIMGVTFSRLPPWTTWMLLTAVSIYDLIAVLCPRGPLKMLIETAQEREEEIPALLYSSAVFSMDGSDAEELTDDSEDESDNGEQDELRSMARGSSSSPYDEEEGMSDNEDDDAPLLGAGGEDAGVRRRDEDDFDDDDDDGVKLGLGDFIFYSALIGQAATNDLITVVTCFIALLSGLLITLVGLGVFGKALPALPASIFLGTIFYFFTKVLVLPLIFDANLHKIIMF